jgi:hypothetical protein
MSCLASAQLPSKTALETRPTNYVLTKKGREPELQPHVDRRSQMGLSETACDEAPSVQARESNGVTYGYAASGDLVVCTPHYVATVSHMTGALQSVFHRDQTGQLLALAVTGEDFSTHEFANGGRRYDFDSSSLTNLRISVPSPHNTLGHALYPSSSYLKVITEGDSSLPLFTGERRFVLRRTYEFTRGHHIYVQMELVSLACQSCPTYFYDLTWEIHIGPQSGTIVSRSTDDLVIQYPYFDHMSLNAREHPVNLMDQHIEGYLESSHDVQDWSRQWARPVLLDGGQRLLSNAVISVLQVGETNQWIFEKYPYTAYQFYPGFGLRVKEENEETQAEKEPEQEEKDIACSGLPHQEMGNISGNKRYIAFTQWNDYEQLQQFVPVYDDAEKPQRLDALMRGSMHVLERLAHDGGWLALPGWRSGDREYPCGHLGSQTARTFPPLAYLWAYLSLEWSPPITVGGVALSPWHVANHEARPIYEQLQETAKFFTQTHPLNFADSHDGIPYIGYSSHNRENDPTVPGDQKVLGAIAAHAFAIHFIAIMRDTSRLAKDTPNAQKWAELLQRYHPGTRALFRLLYPAYDGQNPATKYYGFLGYALDLKYLKDNGVGYTHITYMGSAPMYLHHNEYELAFVDAVQAARNDHDPLRTGAQPCPGTATLGTLTRVLPLVLSFIQTETFPDYANYPGTFANDTERQQCLDLVTSYPNTSHYLQSITDLEEILTFGHTPHTAVHDPTQFIQERGGRRWIRTNVEFHSDWVPGFWWEVPEANVPAEHFFAVNLSPARNHHTGSWTAYRQGKRLELMTDYPVRGIDITVAADFPVAAISKRTYSSGVWSNEVVLHTSLHGQQSGNRVIFSLPKEYAGPKDLLIVTLFQRPSRPGPLRHTNILDHQWLWNYDLSWSSASSQTPFWYELQETYNTATFTAMTPSEVLPSTTRRRSYTQKPDGTYSYRLRACNDFGCSEYTDVVGVEVHMQPSAPNGLSITYTGATSYALAWGVATGYVSGYELYEATLPNFSNQVLAEQVNLPPIGSDLLNGLNQSLNGISRSFVVSNKATGTYYYRVRAKNGNYAGPYTILSAGSQPLPVVMPASTTVTVTIAPTVPPFLNVPATATDDYRVTWGVVPQATSYVLEKSDTANFSTSTTVYTGPGTPINSTTLAYDVQERGASGQRLPAGTVRVSYFRVQGCFQPGICTAYTTGMNPVTVQVP